MKAGSGEHFEQAYNAQAAVDTEGSMLVLGVQLTDAPNDAVVPTGSDDALPEPRLVACLSLMRTIFQLLLSRTYGYPDAQNAKSRHPTT